MFEAISLATRNKLNPNHPLDIGTLVECMLFYDRVIIIATYSSLLQLINYFGVDRLLMLIEEELLNIIYPESILGIHAWPKNNVQFYNVGRPLSPQNTYHDDLRQLCINVTEKAGKGRKIAQRLHDKIHVVAYDNIILEGARKSMLDQDYIATAAKIIISELIPEAGDISRITFNTENTPNGIVIDTNIDFHYLNKLYHRRVLPLGQPSFTQSDILFYVLDLEIELFFASSNLSELSASNLSARLAERKIDYILSRSNKSKEELNHFTEFIFNDAKSLRESINSNRITLDELMPILESSKRFKKWIVGIKPDSDLIKSYYEEVTQKTFVDKLPGKSIRWGLFTGIGLAVDVVATGGYGVVSGAALGALDTFYLDRLIAGWKPNQYIDEVKALVVDRT